MTGCLRLQIAIANPTPPENQSLYCAMDVITQEAEPKGFIKTKYLPDGVIFNLTTPNNGHSVILSKDIFVPTHDTKSGVIVIGTESIQPKNNPDVSNVSTGLYLISLNTSNIVLKQSFVGHAPSPEQSRNQREARLLQHRYIDCITQLRR